MPLYFYGTLKLYFRVFKFVCFIWLGLSLPEGQEVGKIGILKTRERFVYYLVSYG